MEGQNSIEDSTITKWFRTKTKESEKEIELSVVVEFFRFIFYTWFCIIVFVGMALTYGVTVKDNEEFYKLIESVFGAVNICAYFDFQPSTYILPSMYAIQLILIYKYSLLSVFRAWIARLENKISGRAFFIYCISFIYFCFSAAIFSTIFAVQPDPKDPKTIVIHTLPFTNFVISITILQIAVTWFGRNVSWKGLSHRSKLTKRLWTAFTYICLSILIVTSTFKVVLQINALSDVGKLNIATNQTQIKNISEEYTEPEPNFGKWFNVHEHKVLLQIMDKLWLLAALVIPMFQSGYLTFKTFDTHLIIFTIRDNRRANIAGIETENDVNEHELSAFSNKDMIS